MKTLYADNLISTYLKAVGKETNSLKEEIDGDDFRVIAQIIDLCEKRKRQINAEAKKAMIF